MKKLTTKQKITGGAIVIITTIVGAVIALGNDYYVNSVSGNDSNNCSIISPCKTITKGMSLLVAGDVLHLEGDFRQSVTISKKGTADKLITITGGRMGCLIISGEYISVDDVEVVDCQSHGVFISGDYISFTNSKVHSTVMDNSANGRCTGSGQWGSAVKVYFGASNIVISGNEVYENCGEGIAATRGTYVTIANNIVYDNFSVDIYIDNSHHVTVENNFTYYTNNTNFYRGGAVGTGIGIASEYYSGWGDQLHDILINNNTIQHAKGIRLYTQVGTKSVPSATITNNIFIQVNSPFVNVPGAIVSNNVAGTTTNTYYVSTSGNDANTGTQTAPFKTIAKVNGLALRAGDSVLFKRGDTWAESVALNITGGGTNGEPITFGAYGTGALPVLDGRNQSASGVANYGVVVIGYNSSVSYVTLENLEIVNGAKQTLSLGGTSGNASNITIQNSVIHTNRTDGYMLIYVANHGVLGSTHDLVFANNHIYDSRWNCIRLTGGVVSVKIYGNEIDACLHNGIDTYPGTLNNSGFEIYGNDIHDFGGGNGAGIYAPGVDNFSIHDNRIHDPTPSSNDTYGVKVGKVSALPNTGSNVTVNNNTIWNIDTDNTNTHWGWGDTCVNCSFTNNLVCASAGGYFSGVSQSGTQIYASAESCTDLPAITRTPTVTKTPTPPPTWTPVIPACDPEYLPFICIYKLQ